ncbi:MAG: chemotaxis protein CheA [Thermoplasmata archaeon]
MYVTHSKEAFQNLNDKLLELEKNPQDQDVINECFRLAHTIKGMARTMMFERTGEIAHSMESILDGVRSKRIEADPGVIDLLFQCVDAMEMMTEKVKNKKPEPEVPDLMAMIRKKLEEIRPEEEPASEKPTEEKKEAPPDGKKAAEEEIKEKPVAAEGEMAKEKARETTPEKKRRILEIGIQLNQALDMPSARAILVIKRLEKAGRILELSPPIEAIESEKFGRDFTVRIETAEDEKAIVKAISMLKGVQKVVSSEKKPEEKIEQKPGQAAAVSAARKPMPEIASVRVKMDRLDDLLDTVGELAINKISLLEIGKNINDPKLAESLRILDRLTGELQYNVLRIRMVPIETVFSRFPRMIRDLAKQMGKELEFVMEGQEIELDRTVIDKLGDLLVHLLRNSVDHGIESPEEREKAGKRPVGILRLSASQEQNRVMIKVEDDGRGIDPDKLRKKALEKGILTPEELNAMGDDEVMNLLATPGFSTAEKVTEISGRGVGLDAVKSGVESLGGQMTIESVKGQGTKVIIRLPLTLAIILAMLVRIGKEIYAISVDPIIETISVKDSEIRTIGGMKVVRYRNEIVPLIYLSKILGISDEELGHEVVIIESGQKKTGLVVQELLGQQEIVVKPLDKFLRKLQFLGGATILGSGEVALILDANGLMTYAKERMRIGPTVESSEDTTKGDQNARAG